MLFPSFFNAGPATYEIEQSLRFNKSDSARLSRTPSSAGNLKTGTISFWIKRGALQTGVNTQMSLLGCTGNGSFLLRWRYQYDYLEFNQGRSGNTGGWETLSYQRDPGAWMHIVLVNDYTNTTSTDRSRIYINGVRQDLNITSTLGDSDGSWNSANVHYIGYQAAYFDGYMAEFHNVDGTALDPTDFGEYDDNGVWRPKRYTGSHGTNGFYLKFDPSATNGIGHDHSGNGNNWTPTGFDTTNSTASTYDVMSDTPTTNYPTFNALYESINGSLANGNLEINASSNTIFCLGNFIIPASSTNKYYWEVKYEGGPNFGIGIKKPAPGGTQFGDSMRLDENDGQNTYMSGVGVFSGFTSVTTPSTTTTAGDIIGVAYDPSAGTIKWTKNGSAYAEASGLPSVDVVPLCGRVSSSGAQTSKFIINFGQRAFAYTPPTNFLPLNTSNLPAPTIKDGSEYFNTLIYTGASPSDKAVTGVGFQPDFTWIKARTQAYSHALYDAVRGATKELHSDTTDQEDTDTNGLKSFDSDGFTVGSDGEVGDPTGTRVSWNWLAGNGTQTLTAGTQSATVSVNATAGFSIATYTGTTSAYTVAHGLGVAPKMYISKGRDTATAWWVFHEDIGPTAAVRLDGTGAQVTATSLWNDTSPTSTVCHFGAGAASADPFLMYAFAEVEGYSKFGSYTGNGSTDGPFVYCGFRPAWLLFKRTNAAEDWVITDSTRRTYNQMNGGLRPNSNAIEWYTDDVAIDFTANGFKIRSGDAKINASGSTYVFIALAENPFGGDGVSPATAR